MVDKIKPLKLEDTTSGSSFNFTPTETSPSQDYLATKGIAFENSDSFLIDKIGRELSAKVPTRYAVPTYLGNGEINTISYYNSATFVDANRIAKVTMAYDVNIDPTSEVWVYYDTDGTTVLRTVTFTFSNTSFEVTQIQLGVT